MRSAFAVVMRTLAALLLIGMTGALTAPAAAQEQAGSCTPRISSAARVERGELLQMRYTVCAAGRIRMGLVARHASHEVRVVSAPTWPPANSGCGDDGPTMSSSRPTVRLTSTTMRLRDTGRVRIHLRGNQTAAMTVTIAQAESASAARAPAATPAPPRATASWHCR